jgi:catechol 2,3-dioxygenase-like lactoylglutathione lyase family enzyme
MTTEPIAPIKALSHMAIRCTDLDRSVDFYRKVFGYDVFIDNRSQPGGYTVIGLLGGVAVELVKTAATDEQIARAQKERPALGHSCIALSVEDIDATHAKLKAAGLTNTERPEQVGTVRVVFIRDPDGALLEFIQLGGRNSSLAEIAGKMRARAAQA